MEVGAWELEMGAWRREKSEPVSWKWAPGMRTRVRVHEASCCCGPGQVMEVEVGGSSLQIFIRPCPRQAAQQQLIVDTAGLLSITPDTRPKKKRID